MKVALVYPPTCDPTAPYLSIPTLAAYLRAHGVEVLTIDANVEGWELLLRHDALAALGARLERRLEALDARASLTHQEQLEYVALFRARGEAADVPRVIEGALAVLRDRSRFYDEAAYERAIATVEAAQRLVSAAHAPLSLDFVAYRTPFSLLAAAEIARDAAPDRDPFHAYFVALARRIGAAGVSLVGISVAFPGQVQPAYALALALRAELPDVHVTVGGPALTQMLLRLSGSRRQEALGPFHSAVLYEGEIALLELTRTIERGDDHVVRGCVISGTRIEELGALPAPDFDGLPLDRYLTPELVLPYDPTRGCYWGTCAFCHYGLAEVGTARYRERPAEVLLDHLEALSKRHGVRVFYFSEDVCSPRLALRIARGIRERGLQVRWGTDMRPERSLSAESCAELAAGGLLSAALGIESGSPRVLRLIDKGMTPKDVARAVTNLSRAGIAVEAMCFTDFPTETYREALESVRFVSRLEDELSLFIVGRFDLTRGSLVAERPADFGIGEVWQVEGDLLGTGLFYAEERRAKTDVEDARLEEAVSELSAHFRLHRYPWAGALSTAHTLLWYAHHGKDVFRRLGRAEGARVEGARARRAHARFDFEAIAEGSAAHEAAIWERLVFTERRVGRARYEALAADLPSAAPAPREVRYEIGEEPRSVGRPRAGDRPRRGGRRRSAAHNATKK